MILAISEHRITEYLLPFRQIQVSVLNGELVMDTAPVSALDGQGFHPTRHWHKLDDGRLQCDLCPRFCKLHDGQRGLCFVRINDAQQIKLTTWGRSSGFVIDPIEKKPLNHFLPGSSVFSFGTAGCNLACKFCQNWDISKSREMDTLMDRALPQDIAETALNYGAQSVAFTYNDPVIFHEYAIDVAAACREVGLKTVAVTAGYVCPEPRAEFYRLMDAANVDLKAFSERFYFKITGSHLANVLDTIQYIYHDTDTWLELTTLLIPGENDSETEIAAMCDWIFSELGPEVPLHFTVFHPDWKMRDKPVTPRHTVRRARQIAIDHGLHYVYVGNVHDKAASSTYCHQCGALLIGRDVYDLSEWMLDAHGCCRFCGMPCAGVFKIQPGHWGSRRLPVSIDRQTSY